MKNSLGNPARGDAYYQRGKEVNKIYRVLKSGASIYLSAPRRVGKTSILKYIEENPEQNFYFIYIITESVDSQNEFFKTIFEDLLKSEAINKLTQISTMFKDALANVLGKVKKVYEIEIREAGETDYYEILIELFSNIKAEHGRVVLLIDEFPQTIQNILNTAGEKAAEAFIQKNRELRHHKHLHEKINFIYTGSMALFPLVEKVTSLVSINDLRTVEVEPLPLALAKDFLTKLLETDNLKLNDSLLDYILEKIGWLIPFHLQLIEQEILDVYESKGGEDINKEAIDIAFEQLVHTRNKPQFEPYFARLKTLFKDDDYKFVLEALKNIAINHVIDFDDLSNLSIKYQIKNSKQILEILEGDGYIFKTDNIYRYTSPILKLWCQKHICS
jgi:hypothetical protein